MAADVLAPGFWEIGSYKHNVKRFKDGVEQLDDYCKMARERADIEAKYSKMLSQHAEKWNTHVDRTVSAGSIKTVWKDLIGEASSISRAHNNLKDNLLDNIVKETFNFRKNSLHTSVFKGPKEIREIEEHFEKAQKPWRKLSDKMEDKRSKYYNTCRQEKSALVNLQNCEADTSISQDGTAKCRDRHAKMKEEVQKTKIEYEKALNNLNEYKNVYVEAMAHVFKMCQDKELERSQFFVGIFGKTQKYYSELVKSSQLSGLHQQLEQSISNADAEALKLDLSQWSQVNGVDAPCKWPTFIEYSPEIRNIASKGGSTKDAGGVVLTRQIIKNDEVLAGSTSAFTPTSNLPSVAVNTGNIDDVGKSSPKSSSDSDSNTFDSRKHQINSKKYQNMTITKQSETQPPPIGWNHSEAPDSPPLSTETPDSAKYGDFDEYQCSKQAVVLYDYEPTEGDEIGLKKGAIIEVLSEPDSLGWCRGKYNGMIGLFPASYVQCSKT